MSGQVTDDRHGLTSTEVYESVVDFHTPRLFLMTLPVVALWVYVFWGGLERKTVAWFPVGALAAGAFWSVRAWKPWEMAPHRMMKGLRRAPPEESAIQRVTARYFATLRCRLTQGLWVSAGAVFPWLIYGVSDFFKGRPLRLGAHGTPPSVMIFLGVVEGVRGRSVALASLAAEFRRAWPALHREAKDEAAR